MPDFSLEIHVADPGLRFCPYVAGVDEVGMGPLAGPIVAAAVVLGDLRSIKLSDTPWILDLDDSKKLSPRKRERLYSLIVAEATVVGVGWATNFEVDDVGIVNAHGRALTRAFTECRRALGNDDLAAVVDGEGLDYLRSDLGGYPSVFRDKADSRSYSVAAASIVAKVTRDFYMVAAKNTYPHHGFEQHKGYGTAGHLEALKRWGVTALHRRTFEPIKSGNFLEYTP